MTAWLKIGYFTASQEAQPDYWLKRAWVSDGPGRVSPRWKTHKRPTRGNEYPPFGPQYEVGDRLVIYITSRSRCPAILEVVAVPRWDPAVVDEAQAGEGERWGVVTDVKGIRSMALDDAPSLQDLGVSAASIQRKGHVELEDWQYAQAELLIGDQPATPIQTPPPTNAEIPIEDGKVEGYEVAPPIDIKRAIRREARLVRDYSDFLTEQGDEITRNKVSPPDVTHPIYSDLFNKTRSHLVEAKAGTSRGDIRMAIGQLADYSRFIGAVKRRAVLLEAKPQPDLLDLLSSQGIDAIWRSAEGFEDNAGGTYV